MAIHLRTGDPRQGKSYSVIEQIALPAALKGLNVWTNIPLKPKGWQKLKRENPELVIPTQFDIEDIVNNSNWFQEVLPKGVLLLLDEATLLWPSGMTQKEMTKQHMLFLTKHGHMVNENGVVTNVVLIVQNSGQIAKAVRDLVEEHGIITKLDYVGLPNHYGLDVYRKCQNDQYPKEKALISQKEYKRTQSTYDLYVSQTDSDFFDNGDEDAGLKRNTIWTKKLLFMVVVCPCIFLMCVIFGYFKVKNFMQGHEEEIEARQEKVIEQPKPVVPKQVIVQHSNQDEIEKQKLELAQLKLKNKILEEEKRKRHERYNHSWRIVGSMQWTGKPSKEGLEQQVIMLSDGNTLRRYPGEKCEMVSYQLTCYLDDKVVTTWTGKKHNANSPSSITSSINF